MRRRDLRIFRSRWFAKDEVPTAHGMSRSAGGIAPTLRSSAASQGQRVLLTLTPIADRVAPYAQDEASVSVWLVGNVGVANRQRLTAVFGVSSAALRWLRGDWRLAIRPFPFSEEIRRSLRGITRVLSADRGRLVVDRSLAHARSESKRAANESPTELADQGGF